MAKVIYGTWGVVNEGRHGRPRATSGPQRCGKTGTAQLASNEFLKGKTGKNSRITPGLWASRRARRPKSWWWRFTSTAGTGQFAAPIVRDVLKAYFDKKARLAADAETRQTRRGAETTHQPSSSDSDYPSVRRPEPPAPEANTIVEAALSFDVSVAQRA